MIGMHRPRARLPAAFQGIVPRPDHARPIGAAAGATAKVSRPHRPARQAAAASRDRPASALRASVRRHRRAQGDRSTLRSILPKHATERPS